jgi:hypothetical protein
VLRTACDCELRTAPIQAIPARQRRDALPKQVKFLTIRVDANYLMAARGETCCGDATYIAKAKYGKICHFEPSSRTCLIFWLDGLTIKKELAGKVSLSCAE